MTTTQPEVIVHYVLNNSTYGKVKATRLSNHSILVRLPDLAGHDDDYVVPMDIRDRRTLFVFDGDVPNGGIPKRANIVRRTNIGFLRVPAENVRKSKLGEEPLPYLTFQGKPAALLLYRNFLLLPGSRSVVRTYRPKSLSPRYLIIEVDKSSGKDNVRVLTTDY